jgi:hypothetical protein
MSAPLTPAERIGRRVGFVVFGALVVYFTGVSSAQIIRQVWFPEVGSVPANCRESVRSLLRAVERARSAAAAEDGETSALEKFRTSLNPEWRDHPGVERACQSDPEARAALVRVDRLRYAEEHAVRYEANELARRRRTTAGTDLFSAPQGQVD